MQFYHLTHPLYTSDVEEDASNPIRMIPEVWMPGIICAQCGSTWAGSRRLYLPINDTSLKRRLRGKPLPDSDWTTLAHEVAAHLHAPSPTFLYPGDILGTPMAELQSSRLPDMMHPFPGQIIVVPKVVAALRQASITGYRAVPIESRWSTGIEEPPAHVPRLYEIVVEGSAWRLHMDEERITVCSHCRRTIFPEPENLTIDTNRWDGSDFFIVDRNPNMVCITEKVYHILLQEGFLNYRCIPI